MHPRSRPHGGEGGTMSSPTMPSPTTKWKECNAFKEGRCHFGERCKFSHSVLPSVKRSSTRKAAGGSAVTGVNNGGSVASASNTGSASQNTEKTKPCFAWQRGLCSKGNSCPYRHDAAPQSPTSPVHTQIPSGVPSGSLPFTASQTGIAPVTDGQSTSEKSRKIQKQKPCFAWQKGNCTKGDQCSYKHEGESVAKPEAAAAPTVAEQLEILRKGYDRRRQEDEWQQQEIERQRQETERRTEEYRVERERVAREQEAAEARRMAEWRAAEEREIRRREEEQTIAIMMERQRVMQEQEQRRARESQILLQTLVNESNPTTFGAAVNVNRPVPPVTRSSPATATGVSAMFPVETGTPTARGSNRAPAESAQQSYAQTPRKKLDLLPRGALNMPNATVPTTSTVTVEQTEGPSSSSHNPQKTKPCFAWQKGHCYRGSSCPYRHDPKIEMISPQSPTRPNEKHGPNWVLLGPQQSTVSRAGITPAEGVQPSPEKRKKVNKHKPCFAWQNDDCTKGDQCQHKHEGESGAQRKAAEAKRVDKQLETLRQEAERRLQEDEQRRREDERRRQEDERRLEEDKRRREADRLEREAAEEIERQRREKEEGLARERQIALQAQQEKRARESQVTLQTLVKESNLVTFGSGLDIRRVIPGFELCKITIRNIPADATQCEISNLFLEQGMDDSQFKLVRCSKKVNGQVAEFLMRTETAQAMAVGLEDLGFRNNALAFEVGANASWGSMASSTQANDPRTLTIIWYKPSATMIATYDTMEVTRQKARELDRHFLRGRHISATLNTRPNGAAAIYWVETSIRLANLDPGTTLEEIQTIAGTYMVRSVKSNVYDLDAFVTAVKHSMEASRSTPGSFQSESLDGNRMKAVAQFPGREEMEKAAQRLERPVMFGGPKLRVILPTAHHYTISISTVQYRAQKTQWDAMAEDVRGQSAFVRVNERRNGVVYINVQGSEQQKVGPLKVRVESLVAGETLDGEHWHSTFMHAGMPLFQRVKQETGVLVSVDGRFHALRVFGPRNSMPGAKEIIRQEVERLALTEWEIPISRKSIRFFVATGLQILKDSLGDDNVTLDVASKQCKLKLRGGDDAIQHARRLVEESVAASNVRRPLDTQTTEGDAICPICYDTATHPEVLVCGHSCCEACLRHYITSAAGSNNFPLICMGNDATCRTPIAIPVIQRFLTEHRFNHLVDAVFDAHIQSNARKFKYCTTPDCAQIYQYDTGQQFHQCPSCFSKICSSCNGEAHEGVSCEQRRIQNDPAEQDRLNDEWALSNNIKRCPSCNGLTEKTAGCNHMECRCGTHFCWICMGVFSSQDIYPHMRAVHGGIRTEDPAAQLAARRRREQELAAAAARGEAEERGGRSCVIM